MHTVFKFIFIERLVSQNILSIAFSLGFDRIGRFYIIYSANIYHVFSEYQAWGLQR